MLALARRLSRPSLALTLTLTLVACGGGNDSRVPEVGTTEQAATLTLVDCNAASLVAAIDTANGNGEADTINLLAGCTYTFGVVNNVWYGPNALPAITSDITIVGNGAVIERSLAAPAMRLFYVSRADLPPSSAGSLTLRDVTVRNGLARGGDT